MDRQLTTTFHYISVIHRMQMYICFTDISHEHSCNVSPGFKHDSKHVKITSTIINLPREIHMS